MGYWTGSITDLRLWELSVLHRTLRGAEFGQLIGESGPKPKSAHEEPLSDNGNIQMTSDTWRSSGDRTLVTASGESGQCAEIMMREPTGM
jgi:hypothetical protein